jgi:hypothetical protein
MADDAEKLRAAAIALQADLILRASFDFDHVHNGAPLSVACGRGVWDDFCDALPPVESPPGRTEVEARLAEALDALRWVMKVIDAAGPINLADGVQIGPTAWYVKMMDAHRNATDVLARLGRDE